MLWVAQFGLRGIGCDEFERKARRGSLVVDREIRRRRPRWRSNGRRKRAWGVHVTWRHRQASRLRACTRARGGRAGQGAGDPHRITVADPYPLFSVPLQNSAKT